MTTPRETLQQARDLVAQPDGWVKQANAVTDLGLYVEPVDPKAVAYCASGAIQAVTGMWGSHDYHVAARKLAQQIDPERAAEPDRVIVQWNDSDDTTVEDVIAAFDRAIQKEPVTS